MNELTRAILVCAIALLASSKAASGEDLALSNISSFFKATPVVPLQKVAEQSLIPGTPILNVSTDVLGNTPVIRGGEFSFCAVIEPQPWFRSHMANIAYGLEGETHLENLRRFVGGARGMMNNVRRVEVKFEHVWSPTTQFPNVQKNFEKATAEGGCSESKNAGGVLVIARAVIADVTLEFYGNGINKEQLLSVLSREDAYSSSSRGDGAIYIVRLNQRLVALKTTSPP